MRVPGGGGTITLGRDANVLILDIGAPGSGHNWVGYAYVNTRTDSAGHNYFHYENVGTFNTNSGATNNVVIGGTAVENYSGSPSILHLPVGGLELDTYDIIAPSGISAIGVNSSSNTVAPYTITVDMGRTVGNQGNTDAINMNSSTSVSGIETITINNNGTISTGSGGKAINFSGAGANLYLSQSGTISGDIYGSNNNGDAIDLNLNSTITGNIVGGTGAITVNMYGGSITGNITGNGSSSSLSIRSYSNTITGTISNIPLNVSSSLTFSGTLQSDATNSGSIIFNNTTANGAISGSGNIEVQNGTFTVANTISGLNGFTVDGAATVQLNSGGAINTPITNLSGTLNVNGGSLGANISGVQGNSGLIEVQGGTLTVANSIANINNFTIDNGATVSLNTNGVIGSQAINLAGTLDVKGGSIFTSPITGSGSSTIDVQSGNFEVFNPIKSVNTFNIESNGTTTVYGAGFINSGGTIDKVTNVLGTLNVFGGKIGGAISSLSGTLNFTGGSVVGPITGQSGSTIDIQSGTLAVGKAITGISNFTVNSSGAIALNSGGSINQITNLIGVLSINDASATIGKIVGSTDPSNPSGAIFVNVGVGKTFSTTQDILGISVIDVLPGNALTINNNVREYLPISNTSWLGPSMVVSSGSTLNINNGDVRFLLLTNQNTATTNINNSSNPVYIGNQQSPTTISQNYSTINVASQLLVVGDLTNNNATSPAIININSGGDISSGSGIRTFTNNGTLNVNSGGTLRKYDTGSNILNIVQVGPININGGTVYGGLTGGAFGSPITLGAGSNIYGDIYGNKDGTVYITGDVTTQGKISNVGTVIVERVIPNTTTFTVKNPIIGVAEQFQTNTGTTTILNSGGDISGSTLPPYTGTTPATVIDSIMTYASTIQIPQQSLVITAPQDPQVAGTGSASAIAGISIVDNVSVATATVDGLTLSVQHGTLNTTDLSNKTIAQINTALGKLQYTPTIGYIGTDTLTILATDSSTTNSNGTPGPFTITANVPLDVVATSGATSLTSNINVTSYTDGGAAVTIDPTVTMDKLQMTPFIR